MKCENCGEDAVVFFRETDGDTQVEHCLCADCARKAHRGMDGLDPSRLLSGLFRSLGAGLLSSMLSDSEETSTPFDRIDGEEGGMMLPVHVRVFTIHPDREADAETAEDAAPQEREELPPSEAEARIPEDAGPEIRARREREALRAALAEAVRNEDYEQAIALRDALRASEA